MIYIDNLGKKRIRIREVRNGETVNSFLDFAKWEATVGLGGTVTLNHATRHRRITCNISDLVINGQPAPADADEVHEALRFTGLWGVIEAEDIAQVAAGEINNAEAVIGEINN